MRIFRDRYIYIYACVHMNSINIDERIQCVRHRYIMRVTKLHIYVLQQEFIIIVDVLAHTLVADHLSCPVRALVRQPNRCTMDTLSICLETNCHQPRYCERARARSRTHAIAFVIALTTSTFRAQNVHVTCITCLSTIRTTILSFL